MKQRLDNPLFYGPFIAFTVMSAGFLLLSIMVLVLFNDLKNFIFAMVFSDILFFIVYFYMKNFKRVWFDEKGIYLKPIIGRKEEFLSFDEISFFGKPSAFASLISGGKIYKIVNKAPGVSEKRIFFYATSDSLCLEEARRLMRY